MVYETFVHNVAEFRLALSRPGMDRILTLNSCIMLVFLSITIPMHFFFCFSFSLFLFSVVVVGQRFDVIFVVSVIYVVAVVVVIVQVRTEWLYTEQCQFVF